MAVVRMTVRIEKRKVPIHPATYVVSCFKQTSRRLSPNELTMVK